VMLKELALQSDGRLNETILTSVLDSFGYSRSREWVRTQMRKLAEIGAAQVTEAGPFLVSTITRAGVDHLERRSFIEGIAKPSLGV
jgi:hypothetical protein